MRNLTVLLLLILIGTAPASAFGRKPRSKKRDRVEAPAVHVPTQVTEQNTPQKPKKDTVVARPVVKPITNDITLGFTAVQADSLVAEWREQQRHTSFHEFFDNYICVDTISTGNLPDSIYAKRLQALASPVQLPFNSIVRGYINRYTDPRYGTISRILGLSQYYFPIIEDELLKEGLPIELRILPIIESALTASISSPMGAVGLWQFMPSTGKSYGLEVNSLVDERRDPARSTKAACNYLKDLYKIYKDWTLALAAYNCGPGNVNKAIARAGSQSKSFWDIYDYLPRETRGYIPAFIGASYAYAYHRQHGIEPIPSPIPLSVDTIHVNRLMHFEQIATTIAVPIETLRQLNPQYKMDIIPATTKSYSLVLPQRHVAQYIACETEIYAKDSMYLKQYISPKNIDQKRQESSLVKFYTVKKGDTPGGIARRFRVTTSQLMRWNKIKSAGSLRIGQKLRIEGR